MNGLKKEIIDIIGDVKLHSESINNKAVMYFYLKTGIWFLEYIDFIKETVSESENEDIVNFIYNNDYSFIDFCYYKKTTSLKIKSKINRGFHKKKIIKETLKDNDELNFEEVEKQIEKEIENHNLGVIKLIDGFVKNKIRDYLLNQGVNCAEEDSKELLFINFKF